MNVGEVTIVEGIWHKLEDVIKAQKDNTFAFDVTKRYFIQVVSMPAIDVRFIESINTPTQDEGHVLNSIIYEPETSNSLFVKTPRNIRINISEEA